MEIKLIYAKGSVFKFTGTADVKAEAVQKIPVGTVMLLLHDVYQDDLSEYMECEYITDNGRETQFFTDSELKQTF